MDLKNGRITVGELLANPAARQIFNREFPNILRHPMLGLAKNFTLNKVINLAKGHVPQKKIEQILMELKRI